MGFFMSGTGKEPIKFDLDFFRAHHGRLYEGRHDGQLKQMYLADWDRDTRAITMASHSPYPYHVFPFSEVEDLVLLPKDSTDFVYENRHRFIQATVGDIEGVFYAAEHFNYGRGWMMLERDGRIQGVVPCSSLKNPVALEERKSGAGSGKPQRIPSSWLERHCRRTKSFRWRNLSSTGCHGRPNFCFAENFGTRTTR
jgi:hypothetical protein